MRTAASEVRKTRFVPDVLTNAPAEFFLGDVNRRGTSSFLSRGELQLFMSRPEGC